MPLKSSCLDAHRGTWFTVATAGAEVAKRGSDKVTGSLLSYVDPEERIPARHPLRKVRTVVNDAPRSLDAEFDRLHAGDGRPSIAPERLIRGQPAADPLPDPVRAAAHGADGLQSDAPLVREPRIDDAVWVPTVFSKNRDRLLTTEMSRRIMAAILAHREVAPLLSEDHFSVDGTLVKAWASMKSFQPKEKATSGGEDGPGDRPDTNVPPTSSSDQSTAEPEPMTRPTRRDRDAEVDFRGERRSNATHASMTDPDARLFKKSPGAGAMLCFMGHSLMENRSGLIVRADLTQADGHAERRAAIDMLHRHSPGSTRRLTLAADRGYDSADFVAEPRQMVVTPRVAQKSRHSAIDGGTTRHPGYAQSQRHRKKIEEPFGWLKPSA